MLKPNSDCRAIERKHPWPMVRLGDVCEILDSKRVPITKKDRVCGDIPYYGATGVVDYVSDFIFDERLVLLGEDGAKWGAGDNSAFIIEGKSWVNNHAHVLRPMSLLDDSFLVWYLNYADLSEYITGVTVPKLNQQRMGQIEIPLPPLSVQREIVARLERELAAVEKMKKGFEALAETAKAEFKAELKEVFEELKRTEAITLRLGDAFKFIDYRGMTPNKITSGVPLITAKNIRFGYMDYRERFYISEEDYAKRQTRGVARCGDILFTTEAPMGYVALADQERFSTGQRIITFQWPNADEHENRYFLYYFMSDVFQNQVRENASGATAQGIKSSRLVNLSVLIPNCQKQRQIAERLDAAKARAEKLEAKAREGVAVCETMRKAILKEAFE